MVATEETEYSSITVDRSLSWLKEAFTDNEIVEIDGMLFFRRNVCYIAEES